MRFKKSGDLIESGQVLCESEQFSGSKLKFHSSHESKSYIKDVSSGLGYNFITKSSCGDFISMFLFPKKTQQRIQSRSLPSSSWVNTRVLLEHITL